MAPGTTTSVQPISSPIKPISPIPAAACLITLIYASAYLFCYCLAEVGAGQSLAKYRHARIVPVGMRDTEVVAFDHQGDEVEPEHPSRGENSEPDVRGAGEDLHRDACVGVLVLLVAADARRVDVVQLEVVVEQHSGAGPGLAVDEGHVVAGEVGKAGDRLRVAGRDDETLLSECESHQPRRHLRQVLL